MIDRRVILSVVYLLGGIAACMVIGIVYSSIIGKPVDNGVSTLAGTVVGYLGGILTNVSKSHAAGETMVTMPSDPPSTTTISTAKTIKRKSKP